MSSNIEKKLINNADRIKELEAKKDKIKAHIDYLDSLINTLDDYHKKIIELKYKYNKTSLQVATMLYRTKRNINKDPKYSQLVPTKCLKLGNLKVIIYNSSKSRERKLKVFLSIVLWWHHLIKI